MRWTEADIPDQSGRVAIVTGANSGIGFETARALAERGARVVLGCRSEEKGEDAIRRLGRVVPGADLRFEPLDLGSLASIEAFAKRLLDREERLDLLCNNAGVMMPPYGRTEDGFELQIGINHLGHFALTGRLLPLIRAANGARIVTVSSLAHVWGGIVFEDLQSERHYNAFLAYGQSKLANLLFTRELARRFERAGWQVVAAAAHPGSTRTNLQRHSLLMSGFVAAFNHEPRDGALPTLYAATAPGVRGGDYFGPRGPFEATGPPGRARSTPRAKSRAVAARLWARSEALTGVSFAL